MIYFFKKTHYGKWGNSIARYDALKRRMKKKKMSNFNNSFMSDHLSITRAQFKHFKLTDGSIIFRSYTRGGVSARIIYNISY